MLHPQALKPMLPAPRNTHRLRRAARHLGHLGRLAAVAALGLAAASAVQAQKVTIDSIDSWGCMPGQFHLNTTRSGFAALWGYAIRVEQEGRVFMDQGISSSPPNGPAREGLHSHNDGGVNAGWPLEKAKPFTVIITTADRKTGELGHITTATISNCAAGGSIVSNSTVAAPAGERLPTVPHNFAATPGDGQITLHWDAPASAGSSPITGYYVLYDMVGYGGSHLVPGCSPTQSTQCTISGLDNGTSYWFRVRAANAVGKGDDSPEVVATPNGPVSAHQIVTWVRPSASGTVSCTPHPVPHGGSTQCTASANPGYVFTRFLQDCANKTCDLTNVTTAKQVTASFDPVVTTSVTPTGGGTVSCSPKQVSYGYPVVCTAVANPGYVFKGFSGSCSGDTCARASVTAPMTVTANFAAVGPVSHPIATSVSPAGSGTVTCTPNPVLDGNNASCTASANAGYVFDRFDGACSGNTCDLSNVTAPRDVVAHFKRGFTGTTVPSGGAAGTAVATFTGGGPTCAFDPAQTAFDAAPAPLPPGQTLPQGIFRFVLKGCDATEVTMKVTWPQPVAGLIKYGKASNTATADTYFALPDAQVQVSGHTTTVVLRDGQLGDNDWAVNGEIVDPHGPIVAKPLDASVTPVPALGHGALALLGLAAAALGLRRLRRG